MAECYRKKQPSCTTPDGREWFASGGGNTNPEYIEREVAKKEFNLNFGSVSHAIIANRLLDAIPAADVVPVVRCKDCYKRDTPWCLVYYARLGTEDNNFCSYGERRGDTDG